MDYAISFRNDPNFPEKINGLFRLSEAIGWRTVKNVFMAPTLFDNARDAEAAAGHALCAALNRQTRRTER